jgi:hypothetical protein
MRKNKHYFLRIAILKTMITGTFYLFVPVGANLYHKYIGWEYWGYIAFGSGIMIIGNLILLIRAWVLAFDKDVRREYYTED